MLLALFAALRMCTFVAMLNFANIRSKCGHKKNSCYFSVFPPKKSEGYTVSLDEELHLETCHGLTPVNFGEAAQASLSCFC